MALRALARVVSGSPTSLPSGSPVVAVGERLIDVVKAGDENPSGLFCAVGVVL